MRSQQPLPALEIMGLILIVIATILFVGQMGNFSQARQQMPASLELGGVPVGGLNRTEAQAILEQVYGAPISVMYADQEIRLDPRQVNFTVNSQAMLARADELRTESGTFWAGFWDYIWRRPEQTYEVTLDASYSRELLIAWLEDIARRYDRPPSAATPRLQTLTFEPGSPGYTLDVEGSIPAIEEALLQPTSRQVELSIETQNEQGKSLDTLDKLLTDYVSSSGFSGVVSVVVIDLTTGEEISINVDTRTSPAQVVDCDIAYEGMGTVKIPIMIEFYRAVDNPSEEDLDLLYEMMTSSSNSEANTLIERVGRQSTERGTANITDTMGSLGLTNTFIATAYDEESNPDYVSTPAREAAQAGTCINTDAGETMQTTAEDLAHMLDMIYLCARSNGGALRAAYPESITQDECEDMLDIMSDNDEGKLIMAGLPTEIEVAHKHGWVTDTHGDAGIVFSPGGDYVLVTMLWGDTTWLDFQESFPVIEDISIAAFNYFNPSMADAARRGLSATAEDVPDPPQEEEDEEGEGN